MKREKLILNLNIRENPLYRFYGLICDPFAEGVMIKHDTKRALALGTSKKFLPKLLRRFGLTDEAIRIIRDHVATGERYEVVIEWDEEKEQGGISIRKLAEEEYREARIWI